MTDTLDYRGFSGSVEYSAEDKILYGQVLGIRGLISYEGSSVEELEECFRAAVDDFLADVESGAASLMLTTPLQVKLDTPLAERAVRYAQAHHLNVDSLVEQAVERYLEHAA